MFISNLHTVPRMRGSERAEGGEAGRGAEEEIVWEREGERALI